MNGTTFDEIAERYGEEAAIAAGIAADPDARELADGDSARMRPAAEVIPAIVEAHRRTRGKQKAPVKEQITIRLDADVVAHFRNEGRGWQTRLNAVLRRTVFETADHESAPLNGADSCRIGRAPGGAAGRRWAGQVSVMDTMTISLPDALKSFVDQQVASRGYDTSDEYVRELIRRDRDRQRLRGLLLDGADSTPASAADGARFDPLRERVRRQTTA